MSNNKQSSVEWVIENLTLIHALLSRREIGVEFFNRKYNEIVERGKAMHEEEMIEFAQEVFRNRYNQVYQSLGNIADDIYNETFNNDEQ